MNSVLRPVFWLFCFVLTALAGCGQPTYERNNMLGHRSIGLVNDAAMKIVSLYPPASTRFVVSAEPHDDDYFGIGLIGKLREAGYAVHEYSGRAGSAGRDRQSQGRSQGRSQSKDLLLTYVVDEFDNHVRVLVHLGSDALSRIYEVDGRPGEGSGNFSPASEWTWRRGRADDE